MLKKMMLLAVAVAAVVAFAAPASASATISANVEEGGSFTAFSSDLVTSSAGGELRCEEVDIAGTLGATEEQEAIEGTVSSAFAQNAGGADCSTSTPGVTAMVSPTVSNVQLGSTEGTATATFTAILTVSKTVVAVCHYHGTIHFTYNHNVGLTGANSAVVTGSENLEQQAETCNVAKGTKATLSGHLALTHEGTAIEITTP